jgi:hypothetical protein
MSPQTLLHTSAAIGALSLLTLLVGVVRWLTARLRPASNPSTETPRVTWSSPIVLIPSALIVLALSILVAFFSFYWGCSRGPDLC